MTIFWPRDLGFWLFNTFNYVRVTLLPQVQRLYGQPIVNYYGAFRFVCPTPGDLMTPKWRSTGKRVNQILKLCSFSVAELRIGTRRMYGEQQLVSASFRITVNVVIAAICSQPIESLTWSIFVLISFCVSMQSVFWNQTQQLLCGAWRAATLTTAPFSTTAASRSLMDAQKQDELHWV